MEVMSKGEGNRDLHSRDFWSQESSDSLYLWQFFVFKLALRKWNFVTLHSENKGEYSNYPDAWCKASLSMKRIEVAQNHCAVPRGVERQKLSKP